LKKCELDRTDGLTTPHFTMIIDFVKFMRDDDKKLFDLLLTFNFLVVPLHGQKTL